jgi:hypothetical protein
MTTSVFDPSPGLADDAKTCKRLELNLVRNRKQDHTALLDEAAAAFEYDACRDVYWNPEAHSLLYGTPIWDQASPSQRVRLNQLYWVAYYAQIISAEIATIYFNQTSAAGLYALEDFRTVCDTLDLESAQERAHIAAFRRISEAVEHELFGERVFTYAMRGPFCETMVHADTDAFRRRWKELQLRTYGLLSSGNAFIACQYFAVRGLRTLNGKLVQQKLSQYYSKHEDPDAAPIPSKISYYHFMDESYHFNSSMLLAHDVVRSLPAPTRFERYVSNLTVRGCQRDHYHFSAAINGIFWYDPSLFDAVYKVLRSPAFGLEAEEALALMRQSFCEESEGLEQSFRTHQTALESYRKFVAPLDYLSEANCAMSLMAQSSVDEHLQRNRRAFDSFERRFERARGAAPPGRSSPAAFTSAAS